MCESVCVLMCACAHTHVHLHLIRFPWRLEDRFSSFGIEVYRGL